MTAAVVFTLTYDMPGAYGPSKRMLCLSQREPMLENESLINAIRQQILNYFKNISPFTINIGICMRNGFVFCDIFDLILNDTVFTHKPYFLLTNEMREEITRKEKALEEMALEMACAMNNELKEIREEKHMKAKSRGGCVVM